MSDACITDRPCLLTVRLCINLISSSGLVCPSDRASLRKAYIELAFTSGIRYVVAKSEAATMQGGIQLIAVISHILVEIHHAAVKFPHVLDNWSWHVTTLD